MINDTPGLTAICAWIYGVCGATDRIDSRLMQSREALPGVADSWLYYWLFALLAGVLAGLCYFAIGGWWYRVRLEWSGAQQPDHALARRVYLYASQVIAIPGILLCVIETGNYDSPIAAATGEGGWWYFLGILFPFWSCWCSYIGVRTAFVVKRVNACIWFFVLPSLIYALFLIGVIVVFLMGAFSSADVDHPLHHNSAELRFSYPGNWWIDDTEVDYDPEMNLTVEPYSDAICRLSVYDSEESLEHELEVTIISIRAMGEECREVDTFTDWGEHLGIGRTLELLIEGSQYRVRLFVGILPDGRYIETMEFFAVDIADQVGPGYELIRNTCRVGP